MSGRAGSEAVARELIAFGRELEESGDAQVGGSFTGDPALDEPLVGSPNAFLFGVLFTQGIPAERAWAGPALLQRRLGTLDVTYLAEHPHLVREAFQEAPMLHRFKETMPRWIVAAATKLCDEYGGDASRIWPPGSSVIDVTERLSGFSGIGRKKAVMATELLIRHFGVEIVGRERGSVAYDVHVRRVFLRTGLIVKDTPQEVERAASQAYPVSPGTLDLPAWLIGRDWCRPKVPLCNECRLGGVCPRLTSLNVTGVGAGRRAKQPLLG